MQLKNVFFSTIDLRKWAKTLLLFITMVSMSYNAFACKIEPIPLRRPMPRPLEAIQTREHNVSINIRNQVAEITVQATFFNPNNADLEGDYWFPLYADAAVTSFSMIVDGKEMQAELLDADQARRTYEEIVRRRQDPALLEFVGMRMLRQRVYPIKARSELKIFLKYSQLLNDNAGVIQLKYPLSSAKPDNKQKIGKVSISVFIESNTPIKNIYSSSHEIKTDKQTDETAKVKFEAADYYPDKTFVLYYTVSKKDIDVSLISHKPDNEDGYFTLLISPKIEYPQEKILPKEFVFVIDTSGSMSGKKIESAKNALTTCVNNLNKDDRFNIIRFSSTVDPLKSGLMDANSYNINPAKNFIERMTAEGGTAINDALVTALNQLKEKTGRIQIIVFLTDGLPTIGETNITKIIENTESANNSNVRIFVFGVGSDVNTELLDKLAEKNNGDREYVTDDAGSIETSIGNLNAKISNPILTDVSLEFDKSMRIYDMYPQKLTDIFKGAQIVLTGRYNGSGEKTVKLRGKIGVDENKEYTYVVDFKKETKDEFVPRLWALRKITFLLNEINLKGKNEELTDEIKKLGKKFGIVTPYTSFLITEDTSFVGLPERERDNIQKFEEAKVGNFAVTRSKQLAEKSKQNFGANTYSVAAPAASHGYSDKDFDEKLKQTIFTLGEKAFILKNDGYYYDTEYDPKKDSKMTEIEFLSADYFRLITTHPKISTYLSIGKNIIFKYKNNVYKIKSN